MLIELGLYPQPKTPYIKVVVDKYHDSPIHTAIEGNEYIKQNIIAQKPLMVSRFGSTELATIINYLNIQEGKVKKWDKNILYTLYNNAGFFPIKTTLYNQFANLFIECIKDIDVLAVWFNEGEDLIAEKYCPNAYLTSLRALEPYYHENPWSEALAGKVVLVIHPFADAITKQYEQNRAKLFADSKILPTFILKTIKAVQSIADNKQQTPFKDWFEAHSHMCNQINATDFDVAIIGAGAYGLPLASHVKSLGKQAIHMCGATQILFGVFGSRWETNPIINGFQNAHWIRPSADETPKGAGKVENACYW